MKYRPDFKVGDMAIHPVYGIGQITSFHQCSEKDCVFVSDGIEYVVSKFDLKLPAKDVTQ